MQIRNLKFLKYGGGFLALTATSLGVEAMFFQSSVFTGSSTPKSMASFCGAASIVFLLFGFAGNIGGVARLAYKMRSEKDLNLLRSEVEDLVGYAAAGAIGVLFFWLFLSWR